MAYKAKLLEFNTPMKKATAAVMVPVIVYLCALPVHCAPVEQITFYSCPLEHRHQPHIDEKDHSVSPSTAAVSTTVVVLKT